MKLATIGCGLMASAILEGIVSNELIAPEEILAADKFQGSLDKIQKKLGVCVSTDNKEATKADVLLIALHPGIVPVVLDEIKDAVLENKPLIWTIAAGVPISTFEEHLGEQVRVVRSMPNTCATVGAGITGVVPNKNVSNEEVEMLCGLMEGFGMAERLPEESFLDGIIPVTGSSPAMVFMLIDAMANGAAREGFNWDQAVRLSAQAVLGSAKMVLESGRHPAALQNQVCTPGGLTLEMVKKLEEHGFRNAILEAMEACTKDL